MNNIGNQMPNNSNNSMNNNIINNQMNLNESKNNNQKDFNKLKNLNVSFKLGESKVQILCKSDEKMESLLNRFYNKTSYKKEDYDFEIIRKPKKAKMDLSVEENGIIDNDDIIVVTNKNSYDYIEDNILINANQNQINDNQNTNFNLKILQEQITIDFLYSSSRIGIQVGKNNTIEDMVRQFFKKVNLPYTTANNKNYNFIYSGSILRWDLGKTLVKDYKLYNNVHITFIETKNIIGA